MKIFTALCFMIFTAFLVSAQMVETEKKEELREEITIARSGWTYPIFANDIQFSSDESDDLIEDVAVQTKRLTYSKAKIISFESCNLKNDTKDSKRNLQSYVVSHFFSYEANGRIFAYLFYGLVSKPPLLPGESATGCTAYFKYLYVDEDGDGTFELNCKRSKIEPLPQWIKDLGQLKVKTK